jgi:excisionase family DNA binding protein
MNTQKQNPTGSPVAPAPGEEYLTKLELAQRLHKTTRTIENWCKAGLIPFVKLGRSVLYHWPTVVAAINARMESPR